MSEQDNLCDRCTGTGKVKIPLFLSVADEGCGWCGGTGLFVPVCPKCKKNKVLVSEDLCGWKWFIKCKECQTEDDKQMRTSAASIDLSLDLFK